MTERQAPQRQRAGDPSRPKPDDPMEPIDLDAGDAPAQSDTMKPLPGEHGIPSVAAEATVTWPVKRVIRAGLLILTVLVVAVFNLYQNFGRSAPEDDASGANRDRPSAASAGTRRLDLAEAPPPRVPALLPAGNETADPIAVQRSGAATAAPGAPKGVSPDDAGVLVVSSRPRVGGVAGVTGSPPAPDDGQAMDDPVSRSSRQLQDYQRQLKGLLDNLTQSTGLASAGSGLAGGLAQGIADGFANAAGGAAGSATGSGALANGLPSTTAPGPAGLFGGQLQGSATPTVVASQLADRNLTLPKGTAFTCALKTRVISAASGLVACQVQRHVYGDNGRVLLIERGSHLDGEYRLASVRPGMVRIPVLWTRLRTPLGVTVALDSPATGPLGEGGLGGHVDNRWGERIGAAMLLSLIDDSVQMVIQSQAPASRGDTIVLPSTTQSTGELAEKVLESTINLPPLVYQNQGGIVGIVVARDVDFSAVYGLRVMP